MSRTYSRFLGVGSYLPPDILTNDDLAKFMDTSDEWIRQRTGIEERRWVKGKVACSDLALIASERAIENAGIKKEEIDMIILGTLSPDHEFPGSACFLQEKLGLPGIPALDIRQQCTGFIYGASIADQFIRSGMYKKILVVGSEVHSKALDKTTQGREVTVLFGDGAGAAVIGASNEPGIYSTHLHADGRFARELWIQYPGTNTEGDRIVPGVSFQNREHLPYMNGKTVFVHASKRMPEAIQEALAANNFSISDVDLFVLHQANIRINGIVAKKMEIPTEKVFNTIQKFGNTTAATIPIGLDEARKAGKLKPGSLIVSAAFGSGFTWGSMIYRW